MALISTQHNLKKRFFGVALSVLPLVEWKMGEKAEEMLLELTSHSLGADGCLRGPDRGFAASNPQAVEAKEISTLIN